LECIKRVTDGVKRYSAAACAVKVKDTIKSIKSDGLVVSTVDRAALRAVQTPQGFDYSVYKKALDENINNLADFTDDCSLVEGINYPVYMVEGDYKNIKITTPEDLDYAEFLLGRCKE
jgi:2-C-methyl-D-erythritol 4-phosphate cytidylyltransferase